MKVKKDSFINDPNNVMGIFKINENCKKIVFGKKDYNEVKCEVLEEVFGENIVIIHKNIKVKISKEYFRKVLLIFDELKGSRTPNIWVAESDYPIIFSIEGCAIVIAPRIEEEN